MDSYITLFSYDMTKRDLKRLEALKTFFEDWEVLWRDKLGPKVPMEILYESLETNWLFFCETKPLFSADAFGIVSKICF